MAEAAKGLKKPVKLKSELSSMLGESELPRTEITKKLWEYIKSNKLQTKTENGKPENAGKFIVADSTLLPIFKNTKSTSKSGKLTDLTKMNEGETFIKKYLEWQKQDVSNLNKYHHKVFEDLQTFSKDYPFTDVMWELEKKMMKMVPKS